MSSSLFVILFSILSYTHLKSDVICPWCFIGNKRLLRAVDAVKAKYSNVDLDVELTWRPYMLDPSLPVEGVAVKKAYAVKFGEQKFKAMVRWSIAGNSSILVYVSFYILNAITQVYSNIHRSHT